MTAKGRLKNLNLRFQTTFCLIRHLYQAVGEAVGGLAVAFA